MTKKQSSFLTEPDFYSPLCLPLPQEYMLVLLWKYSKAFHKESPEQYSNTEELIVMPYWENTWKNPIALLFWNDTS